MDAHVTAHVALLHPERGGILGRVHAQAVIGDLRRVEPSGAGVQIQPSLRVAQRIGADLDELVVLDGVEALQIRMRPIAVEAPVAGAQREAAAAVDGCEERIEAVGILRNSRCSVTMAFSAPLAA